MRLLLCMPTSDARTTAQGSVVSFCSACQQPVWVAESGQKALKNDPELKVICVACGMAVHDRDDDPLFAVAPGALGEVAAVRGPAAAQEIERAITGLNRAARRRRR